MLTSRWRAKFHHDHLYDDGVTIPGALHRGCAEPHLGGVGGGDPGGR
jgi:hypothetical protein